jgi:hypothetical protein
MCAVAHTLLGRAKHGSPEDQADELAGLVTASVGTHPRGIREV